MKASRFVVFSDASTNPAKVDSNVRTESSLGTLDCAVSRNVVPNLVACAQSVLGSTTSGLVCKRHESANDRMLNTASDARVDGEDDVDFARIVYAEVSTESLCLCGKLGSDGIHVSKVVWPRSAFENNPSIAACFEIVIVVDDVLGEMKC